jgi:hypothetical protein
MKVLCQIASEGRTSKPSTFAEYGKMRDSIIQSPWAYLDEEDFVRKVTLEGYAFYGCLYKGRDLWELQSQKMCWYTQTIMGVDFDNCAVSPGEMKQKYSNLGYTPWLVYRTFSDGCIRGLHSYRILWQLSVNLNNTYEEVHESIKYLSAMVGDEYADKRSMDPGRLWQGTTKGYEWWCS